MMKLSQLEALFLRGEATDADFDGVAMDDVFAIKSNPEHVLYIDSGCSMLDVERAGSASKSDAPIPYVLSTGNPVGPMKDIIEVRGWDLADDRERSQPVLFAHNRPVTRPSLGRRHNTTKSGKTSTGDRALTADVTFTTRGINPFNDVVQDSVRAGFMLNGSVGWRTIESRFPKDDAEMEKRGLGKFSLIYSKVSLSEFSIVPVGMDPGSHVLKRYDDITLMRFEQFLSQGVVTNAFEQDACDLLRDLHPLLEFTPKTMVTVGAPSTTTGTATGNGRVVVSQAGSESTPVVASKSEDPKPSTDFTFAQNIEAIGGELMAKISLDADPDQLESVVARAAMIARARKKEEKRNQRLDTIEERLATIETKLGVEVRATSGPTVTPTDTRTAAQRAFDLTDEQLEELVGTF